ncbi:hypothetical protein Mgra_00010267 [Meloidogyne graminicola]|uniref:Uncharacterized protein n=1 Tax=Meloidogyne graminicola TaxID=189291 RepID=A0A8S9Z5N5_9BILA|nr:hypothetical protein Mgra_00010267 [Meloidogyne graminicola]
MRVKKEAIFGLACENMIAQLNLIFAILLFVIMMIGYILAISEWDVLIKIFVNGQEIILGDVVVQN